MNKTVFVAALLGCTVAGAVDKPDQILATDDKQEWKYPAPPSINDISLGSPVNQVIGVFGNPSTIEKVPDETGMPPSEELDYPGLVIGVYKPEEDREAHVHSIKLTKPKLDVYPGVHIGMSQRQVIDLLGKPFSSAPSGSHRNQMWWHATKLIDNFYVKFDHDQVIEIGFGEKWS